MMDLLKKTVKKTKYPSPGSKVRYHFVCTLTPGSASKEKVPLAGVEVWQALKSGKC
jgi:hypothetical protein